MPTFPNVRVPNQSMRKIVILALLFVCTWTTLLASTESPYFQQQDEMNRIIQSKTIILNDLQENKGKVEPKISQMLLQWTQFEYNPEKLLQHVNDRMSKIRDTQKLQNLTDWYNAPLAGKLAQTQTEYLSAEDSSRSSSPDETRLTLIQQLDQAKGISSSTLDFLNSILRLEALVEYNEGYHYGKKNTEDWAADLKKSIQNNATTSLLAQLKDFSNDELKQLVDFYQSDLGKWYTHQFHDAFVEALGKIESHLRQH